jgi:DNA-binding response OmpR family regulator
MTARPRVLLVEDDPNDVNFMKRACSKAGVDWDLDVAEDGDIAVRKLLLEPRPGFVVLDLKLPKRTGLSVLTWIRQKSPVPSTRVIVLTSSDEPRDREQAVSLGVDLYLIKPAG